MKKIFWILVFGAVASGSVAFGIGQAANGQEVRRSY
jgi:hypothetical protein